MVIGYRSKYLGVAPTLQIHTQCGLTIGLVLACSWSWNQCHLDTISMCGTISNVVLNPDLCHSQTRALNYLPQPVYLLQIQ